MRLAPSLAFAALLGALAAPGAQAGSCPPDQLLDQPRELENAPDIGVDRPVLSTVDLAGWRGMGTFLLRLRRITVAPGGVVPTHWHEDRPSIVYILNGEIIEHSSFCAVPVVHRAGEYAAESGPNHGHWWENKTAEPVVILSTDVVPYQKKEEPNM
ncbi:MAG TPA: cupin domain-containing protein [Paracoccaceae bacterium]|nr:cupin domain-containing protein [Paracoccaceae bacterium]